MGSLDAFGKVISEELRDSALNRYLDIESNWLGTESARELSKQLAEFSEEQKQLVRNLITQSIDNGIHDFLFAIEEGRENIKISVNDVDIAELSDGLQGEAFGSNGWFEKFSQHKEKGI